jgi:hypothetical protein
VYTEVRTSILVVLVLKKSQSTLANFSGIPQENPNRWHGVEIVRKK